MECNYLEPHSLQNHSSESGRLHLLAEDTAHRRPKPNTKHQLIQTQEALVWVHDPVVVHHSQHEAAGKRVAVEQSNRRHRVGQHFVPQAVESFREESWSGGGVLEVQAIGVELGEAGGGDYYAGGVFRLENVEGEVDCFAENLVQVSPVYYRCDPFLWSRDLQW